MRADVPVFVDQQFFAEEPLVTSARACRLLHAPAPLTARRTRARGTSYKNLFCDSPPGAQLAGSHPARPREELRLPGAPSQSSLSLHVLLFCCEEMNEYRVIQGQWSLGWWFKQEGNEGGEGEERLLERRAALHLGYELPGAHAPFLAWASETCQGASYALATERYLTGDISPFSRNRYGRQ